MSFEDACVFKHVKSVHSKTWIIRPSYGTLKSDRFIEAVFILRLIIPVAVAQTLHIRGDKNGLYSMVDV